MGNIVTESLYPTFVKQYITIYKSAMAIKKPSVKDAEEIT